MSGSVQRASPAARASATKSAEPADSRGAVGSPGPLARHILSLADTKRILGIRYSDWILGSPSIETGIAAASMAQDEWGHARLLYSMLKKLGFDPLAVEHDRPAQRYCSVTALDDRFADWADFVAATVVVDGALAAALESFARGGFALARTRVPKMLAEEEYHHQFGSGWFTRLAESRGEGAERVREAALAMLPATLAWLDPDDDPHRALVEDGLVVPGAWARDRFARRAGAVLAAAGIDVAAIRPDRAGWDSERRRGPGAPAEEAVERARGDRNRALFVE